MSRPSLIVAGSFNYPKGSAPSNRIHLYCKAFRRINGWPLVINLDSPFNGKQAFGFIGRYEGIPFCFSRRTYIRKSNFFKRNTERIIGLINAGAAICKYRKKNSNILVLFYSILTSDEIFLYLLCKLIRVKIIKDCSEAPLYIIKNKSYAKFHTFILKFIKLNMYDGIIVISDYLHAFYSKLYPIRKIFQIPILVDLDRFKVPVNTGKSNKKILTYIGFMGGNKDGLEDLLDSAAIAKISMQNLQLNLAGSAPESDMTLIKRKIEQLELTETICLMGNMESKEIPVLLANSDLLVLARPDNNQAKAGFPTKLGEYLASKKPVLITKTGEIPKYLEDNKSAYLAEPGDVNGFAQKLLFALNDPEAEKIGLEGFRVAEKHFDYKLYGEKLMEIFYRLT